MARGCMQLLLKVVNSGLGMVGIAMIMYSLWMLRVWLHHLDSGDHVPVPWFIYTVLGIGIVLCVITCSGHIAAEIASGCCLYIYMVFVFLLFVLEAAITADVFLNHNWEEDFPEDHTGNFDQLKHFIKENFDICKWVGLLVVALQVYFLCIQSYYVFLSCSDAFSLKSKEEEKKKSVLAYVSSQFLVVLCLLHVILEVSWFAFPSLFGSV